MVVETQTGDNGVSETSSSHGDASASGAASSPSGAASPGEVGGGETLQPQPPAYAPNYAYKVLKEQREIPEWARGIIKDQDSEKRARDLFERADGLESVKADRAELQKRVQHYEGDIIPFARQAHEAIGYLEKGDLDTFFERVGLSEMDVLKYAHRRLELKQNPAEAAAHESARQASLQNAELQRQLTESQSGYRQLAVQQRQFELNAYLGRPDIAPLVAALDSRMGPGTFVAEVIRRGQLAALEGKDLPIDEVVGSMAKLFGLQAQPQPAAIASVPDAANPLAHETPREKPRTIPNIQSSGTSPVRPGPKSIDDLRSLYKQKYGG